MMTMRISRRCLQSSRATSRVGSTEAVECETLNEKRQRTPLPFLFGSVVRSVGGDHGSDDRQNNQRNPDGGCRRACVCFFNDHRGLDHGLGQVAGKTGRSSSRQSGRENEFLHNYPPDTGVMLHQRSNRHPRFTSWVFLSSKISGMQTHLAPTTTHPVAFSSNKQHLSTDFGQSEEFRDMLIVEPDAPIRRPPSDLARVVRAVNAVIGPA